MVPGREYYILYIRPGRHHESLRLQREHERGKQLTSYKEYDIKFPAIGDKLIVYEQGGYIYGYDLQSGKEFKITINIDNDQVYSRPTLTDVSGQISSIAVAPVERG